MTRNITIGSKELPMTANGATPLRYKQLFREDLMRVLSGSNSGKYDEADVLDALSKLSFVMAMQADPEIKVGLLTPDDYIEWVEQFDPLDLLHSAPEVVQLYTGSAGSSVALKNAAVRHRAK